MNCTLALKNPFSEDRGSLNFLVLRHVILVVELVLNLMIASNHVLLAEEEEG